MDKREKNTKTCDEEDPFVFVLMPLASEFRDVYESGIKLACGEAGIRCERVDEQLFEENMVSWIYSQIESAAIIVAEMTGRNPNVFYEVGYAHALGKNVVLLTRNAEDIPFDLKQYPHIVYEGEAYVLRQKLIERLRWCMDNLFRPLRPPMQTQIDEMKQEIAILKIMLEPRLDDN